MQQIDWFPQMFEQARARSRNMFHWLVGVGLCLSFMGGQAWGDVGPDRNVGGTAIVAAGFGYQNGDDSTITVKVYDAASGEVLSEEVYELTIKEERSARSKTPEARIFAGGVGRGATDLSNFVLRVYDAKTGEFQWTGQLNLTVESESEAGQMISTVVVPRRAVVTKVHNVNESDVPHPMFLLRAWDIVTGGIIWEDQFSADHEAEALARQTGAGSATFDGLVLGADTFDFRILMFDGGGRSVLWQDRVVQRPGDEEGQDMVDDRAQLLPTWTESVEQDSATEEI